MCDYRDPTFCYEKERGGFMNTIQKNRRVQGRLASVMVLLLLILGAVFVLFPVYMCVLNSLKTRQEMMNNILAFPAVLHFENYIDTFFKTDYIRSLFNTVTVVLVGLIGILLFSAMAGYKLSRTKTRFSSVMFTFFIMAMLIPFHAIMIPLTTLANRLQLQGYTIGLGVIYIGLGVPMAIFLYHGFSKSIPQELDEAALMDGCGEPRLFFNIIFPLLSPITATSAVLNVLWMWNDFLLPLLMLTDNKNYTLLLSTNMLFGKYGNNDWTALLCVLILAMLPVIILYLIFQKYIVKGIMEGAVRG